MGEAAAVVVPPSLAAMQMELTILHGHTYAVRRVRCSPHAQGLIASCSYDMTMRMWDMESPNSLLQVFEHHTGALF